MPVPRSWCWIRQWGRSIVRLGPLAGKKEVIVWGAGRTTRARARHLLDQGLRIAAYVDIDPRKVGRAVGGVPVLPPEDLPRHRGVMVLSYVGSRGARDLIRAKLLAMEFQEERDFLLCA